MSCYCCCWRSGPVMMCGEHPGCAVTQQKCAWPGCERLREMHQSLVPGGQVTLQTGEAR